MPVNEESISSSCYSDNERPNLYEFMSKNEDIWLKLRALRRIIAIDESDWCELVRMLESLLDNNVSDVTIECLSLLSIVMSKSGRENGLIEDTFFSKVVSCLGSKTPGIRMEAVICLYAYSNTLDNFEGFFDLLIQQGLGSPSPDICSGCLIFINTFFARCERSDIHQLLTTLITKFCHSSGTLFDYVFYTLKNIHRILGHEFSTYLKSADLSAYHLYKTTISRLSTPLPSGNARNGICSRLTRIIAHLQQCKVLDRKHLKDIAEGDEINRYKALRRIRSLYRILDAQEIHLHFEYLLKFLGELLEDVVKIQLLSLDILAEVIEKFNCDSVLHLHAIMWTLFKAMSSREQRVKRQDIQILQNLMKYVHPMAVIKELLQKIHQTPVIRMEIINCITVALLNFPLHCFEIGNLFEEIAPFLEDFVLNVRQAAFECYVTLSYVTVAKGKDLRHLAGDLEELYRINKNTANSIIKRVRSRSLPRCHLGTDFTEVLYPDFHQNGDTTVDDMSNDSDIPQITSPKKRSIFTMNSTITKPKSLSLPSKTSKVTSATDTHQIMKNVNKNKLRDFESNCKATKFPGIRKIACNEKSHHKSLLSQKSDENKRKCSSKNEKEFSKSSHDSTNIFQNFPSVETPIFKSDTEIHVDSEHDSIHVLKNFPSAETLISKSENEIHINSEIRYENSLHRNTSTPESDSEELSKCFKPAEEQFSEVSLADSHQHEMGLGDCEDMRYLNNGADLRYLGDCKDNSTVPCNNKSGSSAFPQSPERTSEGYSYIGSGEQGEGDCCTTLDVDTTVTWSQVNNDGESADEIYMHDMSTLNSEGKDNLLEENEIESTSERSDGSHLTLESLPVSSKNFNVFIIDHKNTYPPLFIEEISDSCSESRGKNQNDVSVVIDYPPTPASSVYNLDNRAKPQDAIVYEKYNMVLYEDEIHLKSVNAETAVFSREASTVESADNSHDNDNNYDADESQAGSILWFVKTKHPNYENCTETKNLSKQMVSIYDSVIRHSPVSVTRLDKTKKLNKPMVSDSGVKEQREKVIKETTTKKVTQETNDSLDEHVSCHDNKKELEKTPILANITADPLCTSQKRDSKLKSENCQLRKKKVYESISQQPYVSSPTIKEYNSEERELKIREKSISSSARRAYDPNITHVVKKQINLKVEKIDNTEAEILPEFSSEKPKMFKPRKYKDHGKIDKQWKPQAMLNSTKQEEDKKFSQVSKKEILNAEESETLNQIGLQQYEDTVRMQPKSKAPTERRASHQWIQDIDFLNRSQKCSWSESFERRIERQRPFESGERDNFDDLKQLLTTLGEEDVQKCEEGMLKIIRIATFCPHMLSEYQLNQVILTIIGLTRSLKPSVAGQAALTIGHLFMILKRPFESKFKIVIRDLLQKSGSRTFAGAYNAVIKSIFYIIKGLSPQKAIPAFISEGSGHHNKAVRETTAQFLSLLIEELGPIKSLSPLLSKPIINTAATFAMDGSPLTRHCGKMIFSVIIQHPNFEDLKKKFLSDKMQSGISKMLKKIASDGIEKELLPIDVILKRYIRSEK